MTDFFSLFDHPRQPWLDPNAIKEKYYQLTRAAHPDVGVRETSVRFEEVNEAYRVLSDPKLRIQHLLTLENQPRATVDPAPPEDLQQVFLEIGAVSQQFQRIIGKPASRTDQTMELRSQIEHSLGNLTRLWEQCLSALSELNEMWSQNRSLAVLQLQTLHDRMSYLSRWLGQIKEMQFQLAAVTDE